MTFLSDYGLDDSFVGVCKGVIARIAPEVRVIDVCHQVSPQDVPQGALTLAAAIDYLPGCVHLAIVDPGVGTSRRGVAVRTADGSVFVSPDNGVTSLAWQILGGVERAHALDNTDLFLNKVSKTFQGRDVFAPVAAHLAAGVGLEDVGPQIDTDSLERISLPGASVDDDHVHGEVRSVDHFGNLALNVARADLEAAGMSLGDSVELRLGGRTLQVPLTVTFGDVAPGRVTICEDSHRHIAIAVNQGHAARTLRAGRGEPVVIARSPRPAARRTEPIGVLNPPPQPSTMS